MKIAMCRAVACVALLMVACVAAVMPASAQDVSSSPTSLTFGNIYIGKVSGSKTLTITNLKSGGIVITTISFSCPGYGISSGVAPFSFGATQSITHYSIFFQPTAPQAYNCNFVMTMNDGSAVQVPMTGTGVASTAVGTLSPMTVNFPNQGVGTTSAAQTVTITNSGTSALKVSAINLSPSTFTTNSITLPYTIAKNSSLAVSVFYTPSQVTSETGAIDFTFDSLPDGGATLNGNGKAATSLVISTSPTLPQATQSAAYQATLNAVGGSGSYSWALASGSTLPTGLSLTNAGVITGTLDPSVATGNYTFTAKVTDSSSSRTSSTTFTLGVFPNLADNCNDISFNVPNTSSPIVALTDLGTGTYQGSQGGLYPNGTNSRPSGHDADGLAFAQGIQPLDSNGNYSPTGKYVLLAVGESTAQNEFNRLLPIANSDPAKNPYLVIVNGAQGGATPNNFTSPSSVYWSTTLNNYLPQNGVTANQVVAAWIEDTDGIATGTFPGDMSNLQSQYETMMQTMHTLFPNLKLVYFSSRVYGGYSNGVGNPDNPEPYAFEVGYAVKWAIQDQLNGATNLNYNAALGPVVAPWMSWGPYYWSNGMLGRNDGFVWDCADFSADGTHPSSQFGQLKVAAQLLSFLKSDDTTIPWYMSKSLVLTSTGGDNQGGDAGSTLPTPLSLVASNLTSGAVIPGVNVTFSDGGTGGSFNPPNTTTDSNGLASSTYTLPPTAQVVSITASSTGYSPATFTETSNAVVKTLAVNGGNNQTGNVSTTLPVALSALATNNGNPTSGVTVTFSDGGAGGVFGTPTVTTGSNGLASTTYTLPSTAQTVSINATSSGYSTATFSETATASVTTLTLVSGSKQTGTVGTTLPVPLVVTAKNSSGQVVAGASISYTDGGVGGSFSPNPAVTGSNGKASTSYTLPTVPKVTINVTASDGAAKVSASEKAVVGAPAKLTIFAGNNQAANHTKKLPSNLVVQVTDQYNNPISGVTVTYTDNGAGGTFSTTTPVTTAAGLASVSYTTGSQPGIITISASSSTLGPVNFTETVR